MRRGCVRRAAIVDHQSINRTSKEIPKSPVPRFRILEIDTQKTRREFPR
jgi:hypothetical protein